MKKVLVLTGVLGFALLAGAHESHAENWVKKAWSEKNLEANYEDADSVKSKDGLISWTEKYVLSPDGIKNYNKHLRTLNGCKEAIEKKGEVVEHQIDFEIKDGKYRRVAKRNYNKNHEVVCTDKEMDKSFDTRWHRIGRQSPMEDTYYHLVSTYKLPG
jgi:hypothetical protein